MRRYWWRNTWRTCLVAAVVALAVQQQAGAQQQPADRPEEGGQTATEPGQAELQQWVEQLDADRFSERQRASHKLLQAGPEAFPALVQAALGDSREAMIRALDILRVHFRQGSGPAQEAARQTLQHIAQSQQSVAAGRADQLLRDDHEDSAAGAAQARIPRVAFGLAPAQVQIRVQAAGQAAGRRLQVRNINGVKDIEAHEDGLQVKIHDNPQTGIRMEVTKTEDGQAKTRKYAARNAQQLKKEHPEAHRLYEKYSR